MDSELVTVEAADTADFLFYHSPDNRFFYIVVLGQKTTPKTFAAAFPKAINVTKRKFDFKIRLLTFLKKFLNMKKIEFKIITVADDTFVDNYINT